jgi:hypothetical protein
MHLELRARRTVGVHYATWILSDEHYLAPPRELWLATKRERVRNVVPGELGRTTVIRIGGKEWVDEDDTEDNEIETVEPVPIVANRGKYYVWE